MNQFSSFSARRNTPKTRDAARALNEDNSVLCISTGRDLGHLRRRLLSWFRKNARELPWRESRDPYRIWVSEVMLQQTQVATVISYFLRFVKKYPSLAKLASADEHDVLLLWSGLGYYRRARDLLKAAHILVRQKHKTIPNDPEFVRTLPGLGRYTANAILSQAYDRPLPILEANSVRVLCRLCGIEEDPKNAAVQKSLWQLSEGLLPKRGAGDFNQALMELGALVCAPAKPRCDECPLRSHCKARQFARQDSIALRSRTKEIVKVKEICVVVCKGDRVLLVRRPASGRWANMWEFPHSVVQDGVSSMDAAQRILRDLGLQGEVVRNLGAISHAVTRFTITMDCWLMRHRSGIPVPGAHSALAWVKPGDLDAYPLSTPQRKVAKLLD